MSRRASRIFFPLKLLHSGRTPVTGAASVPLDNLLSRKVNVTIPLYMARAVFYRATTDNFLEILYYLHPYPHGDDYVTREDIKTWGRKWKPKGDAGFLGELEVTKTKEAPVPLK